MFSEDERMRARAAANRVRGNLRDLKKNMRDLWGMAALADHLGHYLRPEANAWAYRPHPPDTRWDVLA